MARKRKKAKDSPERRREVCVLVGRDMLERGKKGKSEEKLRMMKEFIYFIYLGSKYSKRTRRLFCHVNSHRQHFPRFHRTEHVFVLSLALTLTTVLYYNVFRSSFIRINKNIDVSSNGRK